MTKKIKQIFISRIVFYLLILSIAFLIAYMNNIPQDSSRINFTIFDFLFYKPFSYFFQLVQFFIILFFNITYLTRIKYITLIFLTTAEIIISTIVFFIYSVHLQIFFGGGLQNKAQINFAQQSLCAALAKRLAWPGGTFANLL